MAQFHEKKKKKKKHGLGNPAFDKRSRTGVRFNWSSKKRWLTDHAEGFAALQIERYLIKCAPFTQSASGRHIEGESEQRAYSYES